MSQSMVIPNAYYDPDLKVHLVSPQHWSQTREGVDFISGTGVLTNATSTTLYWKGKKNQKMVTSNKNGNNVTNFQLSTSYKKFSAYSAKAQIFDSQYNNDPISSKELTINNTMPIRNVEGDQQTVPGEQDEMDFWESDPHPTQPDEKDGPSHFALESLTTSKEIRMHL